MCSVCSQMHNHINVDYIQQEELPSCAQRILRDISFGKKEIFSNQNGLYYLTQFVEEKI